MAKINVLMVGGKRCGKTTVLNKISKNFNSVLHHDNVEEGNDLFTLITPPNQIAHLNAAEESIIKLFINPDPYASFPVDDNQTSEMTQTSFSLKALNSLKTSAFKADEDIEVEFTDIPGEYLVDRKEVVTNLMRESQAIIIAIDSPSICEENGFYADKCNRISNLKDMLSSAICSPDFLADNLAHKLVLFVPLKCEKQIINPNGTVNTNGMNALNETVKKHYSEIISMLSQGLCQEKITMAIMPISTIREIRWLRFSAIINGIETSLYDENGQPREFKYGDPKNGLLSYYQFEPELLNQALINGPGSKYCEQPLIYILVYAMQYSLFLRKNKAQIEDKKFFEKVKIKLKEAWNSLCNAFVDNHNLQTEMERLRTKKMIKSNGITILQNPLNL